MSRRLSSLALCAAVLLAAGPASAVPESLLRNSPFLPAGNVAPVAAPQNGRLELRGILALGGKPKFTIYDTSNNRAVWLAVGENDGGIRVAAFDAAAEAVTVELEGQAVRLTMKEAQIVNVAVSLPTTNVNPVAGQPGQPGVNPAPPANEQEIQERRNRIVEELRRRRALRQGNQPTPTR
ncbi:MAG: hypothetical protein IPL39_04645 [Opitutaceae bacterium]|nr:hypothetical protein [Opitutaceae bacterium]